MSIFAISYKLEEFKNVIYKIKFISINFDKFIICNKKQFFFNIYEIIEWFCINLPSNGCFIFLLIHHIEIN